METLVKVENSSSKQMIDELEGRGDTELSTTSQRHSTNLLLDFVSNFQ